MVGIYMLKKIGTTVPCRGQNTKAKARRDGE
jgi:hypothetical protein